MTPGHNLGLAATMFWAATLLPVAPAEAQVHGHARWAPGTHFLLEFDAGATITGDAGPSVAAFAGIGGKLRLFPPRFYGILMAAYSHYESRVAGVQALDPADEWGRFVDLGGGLRVYLPVAGELRLLADGLLGRSHVQGRYQQLGLSPIEEERWLNFASVAIGLQYRWIHELSVGTRLGLAFNEKGLVASQRDAGTRDAARPSISAGVTWHF
ncbi:MAG: hypothetical protein OEZ06_10765 [Myxococcales bacterium]|nr:hypothetical protein [Myxococcales bacterium]